MALRSEAVEWQKKEIAAVNHAVAEQKRLDACWAGLLADIMQERVKMSAALNRQEDTTRDLQRLKSDQAEEEGIKNEAEEKLASAQNDTLQAKWKRAIKDRVDTITEIRQAQDEALTQLAGDRALVAAAQTAVDQAVDAALATLTREAATIADTATRAAAAPEDLARWGGTVGKPELLLADLGVNLVSVLDVSALKDAGTAIDATATSIKTIFPDLNQIAQKHGSGRHGTQTGLDRQAARTRSGLTPDQPGDEGGIAAVDDSKPLRIKGTQTASMFLSPELEKLAVDTAIRYLTTQCLWAEYQDGPDWKKLDSVVIQLGPPKDKPGWGIAIDRISGDGKANQKDVKSTLARFRNGEIGLDEVLNAFDAKVGGGADVKFVGGVLLVMRRIGRGWTSVTHYPVPPDNLGWDLTGKKVRLDSKSPVVDAPALSP